MNRKEYYKKWRENNKEHIRQYKKEYAKTHDSSFKKLQKENKQLKEQLDIALSILAEMYPPCERDGFMDKNTDYCSINCGVDEEIFKECWLRYINQKRGIDNDK